MALKMENETLAKEYGWVLQPEIGFSPGASRKKHTLAFNPVRLITGFLTSRTVR
jgi:hypothetical protein